MIGWIYFGGAVLSVVPIARALLISFEDVSYNNKVDNSDRAFALFIGVLSSTIWPLALVLGLFFWVFTRLAPWMLRTPREREQIRRERQELEEQRYADALRVIKEYDRKQEGR